MGAMPQPFPEPADENFEWEFTYEYEDDDIEFGLILPADTPLADQLALDDLFDQGFTWEQGVRLLILREHLYDVPEIAERLTCDPHLEFTRWLYQQGVLSS